MASDTTPIRKRPYPAESDTPDVAADMELLALSVDTAPTVGVGVLSSRPSSGADGDRYYVTGDATAANNGIEWIWAAGSWVRSNSDPLIGAMEMWLPAAAPSDTRWLLCNGQAISRTTYAALFALVGTTYGAGDGSTTFNLPNMAGKFPVGKTAYGTGAVLGGTGGVLNHTHSIPALSVPGLHIPALGVPAKSVSVSGSLGVTGIATLYVGTFGGSTALYYENVDHSWTSTRIVGLGADAGLSSAFSAGQSVALAVSGTASGSLSGTVGANTTDANTTGGGSTGADDTGTQNPPFLSVNYIVRVL